MCINLCRATRKLFVSVRRSDCASNAGGYACVSMLYVMGSIPLSRPFCYDFSFFFLIFSRLTVRVRWLGG